MHKSGKIDARFIIPTIFMIAISVRFPLIFSDFWLDEIWSFNLMKGIVQSPVDILTKIHHDNNHWLNTFFMYMTGDPFHWFVYRIPALLAGVFSIILVGRIASSRGKSESIIATLLFGLSYLQVLYSTEARGYGFVVFFSLLSFYAMERFMAEKSWTSNCLFCLSAVFGFLSHLTFIHVYFALLLWSVYRFHKESRPWGNLFIDLFRCHAVPTLFLGVLYFIDIRHMSIGGGNYQSLPVVIRNTITFTLGAANSGTIAIFATIFATLVFLSGLILLWREKADQWIFFATVIFLSPFLLLLLMTPRVLFIRYFLVCVTFFLLLLSYILGYCWRLGKPGQAICAIVVLLVCFGNTLQIADLLQKGRGHYKDALIYMAEQNDGDSITIGSDHDFRNRVLLDFYARYLPEDKQIEYFAEERWQHGNPQWFITHHSGRDYQPPSTLIVKEHSYVLDREYRFSKLSGWHWFIYRIQPT